MRKLFLASTVLMLVAGPALAQLATPRLSQGASVSQTIGTAEIAIEYHRPGVRDRVIWGGLVPYDEPWRMGANEATTISFSKPVTVEGREVPAGKYSLFAIPGRDQWTLVLNRDPDQWGAYGYDEEKDELRVQVTPESAPHTEWMRFTIDPTSASSALVTLRWERLAVPVRIDVDVESIVWSEVDEALADLRRREAQTLAAAASWALDSGERLEDGLAWIERSLEINEGIFGLWTRARLLHGLDRSDEALPVMEKAVRMARDAGVPSDFLAILEETLESIRAAGP